MINPKTKIKNEEHENAYRKKTQRDDKSIINGIND